MLQRITLILTCLALRLSAQDIPIGTWRSHASYQSAQSLALRGGEVYCASSNGLFFLDLATNSLDILTKQDGLSEAGIATIAYEPTTDILLVVYQNSNIDLIRPDEIIELPLIKNAEISGSKRINHVLIDGNLAYLASDFGVILLDLQRQEIRETYQNLGPGGTSIPVFQSAISRDSIFIATSEGALRASLNDNLQDFNNWLLFPDSAGLPTSEIPLITSRNEAVYAVQAPSLVFKYTHQGTWEQINTPALNEISTISGQGDQLFVGATDQLWSVDINDNFSNSSHPLVRSPRAIARDTQGNLWIADNLNGLVGNASGEFQSVFPNGPARSDAWQMYWDGQQMIGLSGGFDEEFEPLSRNSGYYTFDNTNWTNFNALEAQNSQAIPEVRDLVNAVFNPVEGRTYFASFQEGILVKNAEENFEVINEATPNSPLEVTSAGQVKISDLAVDFQGNLWVANHSVAPGEFPLHLRRTDGTWQSFPAFISAARNPLEILIDNNNFKWIRLSPGLGGGIWVLDDATNQNRYLTASGNSGNLPNNNVNTLALDQDGQIWVGTDEGVAVFLDPFNAFGSNFNAILPFFDLRPLLRAEKVNDIAVNAGNQKWIATNNGLWLFSEDGSEQIHHFTEANSPLPSDRVLNIAINPDNGEVFVATDQGMASYRGEATQGGSTHQNVKVFPNPVTPDFTGTVGISGLVENANVKITDASGRLFYETQAQGGTATWDLRDYTGTRAQTGIYLIFSTNFDGSETLVSKIAVIE